MNYNEKIKLAEEWDGDNTLSTTVIKSDLIQSNGNDVEIQLTIRGGSGDSDNVEIYQFIENDTEGYLIGKVALNSDTEVIKNCFVKTVQSFKIGLKMETGSSETPNYKGEYSVIT